VNFRSDASFPEPTTWNGEDHDDMPLCKVHHHPCQDCGAKTECGGVFEQNYDGWPEVVCDEFNMHSGPNMDFVCDVCHNKREADAHPDRG
jgi:hypothetical protein